MMNGILILVEIEYNHKQKNNTNFGNKNIQNLKY
jgi:hypothetical protein